MSETDVFEGVYPQLRTALTRRGFTALTAIQQAVIDSEARGRNLRISSETGSGKTVAIGLGLAADLIERLNPKSSEGDIKPAPRSGPVGLMITPTRELAVQVSGELAWLFGDVRELNVEFVTGGTDIGRERRMLHRRPAFVVGTPGRMLDHIRSGALDCKDVCHVVLDEADQMLDMGFREELEAIVDALPAERGSHLVSATFPAAVRRLADHFQKDAFHLQGTKLGAANQNIEHIAYTVHNRERYAALVNSLLLGDGERCLVFVKRRADAAEIVEMLAGDGFSAMAFSGDLAQAQRTRTLNAFRMGIVNTLVATDVAARGIDVADISTVVHLDPPMDSDTYTHRSGRTGRAGKAGRSILLVPPIGQNRVRRLLKSARVEAAWESMPTATKIQKMLQKRARKQLHDALAVEEGPSERDLTYATSLLESTDPARLVATLLELAKPKLPREPMHVQTLVPGASPHRDRHERGDSRGRDRDRGSERGDRGDRGDRGPDEVSEGYVRFSINWGKFGGATPGRILAHVCRRGDISSKQIGAVRIEGRQATFEVKQDHAEAFAGKVAPPDEREPKLRIFRDDGRRPSRAPSRRPRFNGSGPARGSERSPPRSEGAAEPPRSRGPDQEG